MKIKYFELALLMVLLLVLLTGCASADDVVRVGQVVAKNYGDDILTNSRRVAGNTALQSAFQSSDEYARLVSSNIDEFRINQTMGQSVDDIVQRLAPRADDILSHTPTTLAIAPPRTIYRTPRFLWSATQVNVFDELRSMQALSEGEAELFLKSTCSVVSYVQLYAEYPSEEYTWLSVLMLAAINELEPPQVKYAEYAASVFKFTNALIEGQDAVNIQEASEILFEGLCLIP